MKESIIKFFDSKMTWTMFGGVAGALFGEKAVTVVNALGAFVMTVL